MLFPVRRLGCKSVTVGAFAWRFLDALVPDAYEAALAASESDDHRDTLKPKV
jgi:hypothetical protein